MLSSAMAEYLILASQSVIRCSFLGENHRTQEKGKAAGRCRVFRFKFYILPVGARTCNRSSLVLVSAPTGAPQNQPLAAGTGVIFRPFFRGSALC